VVELAVSATLIVSALLIAIYAGEAFFAASRAQEAEISAGWDMTAYRLHDFDNAVDYEGGENSPYNRVSRLVSRRVAGELSGMDSYARPGVREGRRFVLSEQRLAGLQCAPMDARDLNDVGVGNALLTFDGLPLSADEFLHRGGYVACRAQVNFTSPYMPRDYRDGHGDRVDLLAERLRNGFNVCGLGKSLRGCDGAHTAGFVVLTNDWALEDARPSAVGKNEDGNGKYYRVGRSIYNVDPVYDSKGEKEGGIGGQQIREALTFLLDEQDTEYGDTSHFKFGFREYASQLQDIDVDARGGQREAHLTPWDDGESSIFTNSSRNVSQNYRSRHFYLGHPDEDFNQP
jgi:hypothetical protein